MNGVRTPAAEVAAMRQRAREGATIPQLMMEFGCSRPTVCKYTKGINTSRRCGVPGTRPAKVQRLRTISLARSASDLIPTAREASHV